MAHVMTNRIGVNEWKRHATSLPVIGNLPSVIEHPVCPRCEKIMLRGNGLKGSWTRDRIANCPSCGYSGRAATVFREYIEQEMYRS